MTGQMTPAGWYPDPRMASTQRYWDGERWTEQVAPAEHKAPAATSATTQVWVIVAGILIAALAVWFVYAVVTADDDLQNEINGQAYSRGVGG